MSTESDLRNEIVEAGKRLYAKDFVAYNDGNISARLNDKELLITPTGVSKGFMAHDQLLRVDYEGNLISGFMKPTSEMRMHLAIYHCRQDVHAVVHAHPPTATGFAVAGVPMDKISLPEMVYNLGRITLSEYATPTTDEVPAAVAKQITCCDGMLLANHGAITVGKDVMDAYFKMETLEAIAKISLVARTLGGENFLSEEQTKDLYDIRRKMGRPVFTENQCGTCIYSPARQSTSKPAVCPSAVQAAIKEKATSLNIEDELVSVIVDTILECLNG